MESLEVDIEDYKRFFNKDVLSKLVVCENNGDQKKVFDNDMDLSKLKKGFNAEDIQEIKQDVYKHQEFTKDNIFYKEYFDQIAKWLQE